MNSCINLRKLFGDTYRITYDEAYDPSNVPKDKLDPWTMQIPGQTGTIYPFCGDRLAVEVNCHPKAARALSALEGVVLIQDGEHEKTFVFPVALFDRVAAIVKPRRRRRGKPENGAKLFAYWFKKTGAQKRPVAEIDQISAQSPSEG